MQNWEAMQPTANYDQHNSWYNNMFAANIKTEPGTTASSSPHHSIHSSPLPSPNSQLPTQMSANSHLENYLKQQQQLHASPMDTMSALTPSPSNNDNSMPHFFESNMQQQLYQQQFQQAQQAAAQNQLTSAHLPLGFNPLTPPGLPNAVMPHGYYAANNARLNSGQTPSPMQSLHTESSEKLQAALTPRNTPPMDVTPPKSPKQQQQQLMLPHESQMEKEQDLISNSSEDMKYMAESEDDETIRLPIYNSHGKMKNYKCKTCGLVAITKVAFWEHTRAHMKPEKILQCPKCPFVTELKHHLEYHIRKHKNIKPFQCDKCSYSCVNKSMLNSHRKSHSSVYQYRCSDCDYATKYCHSFKLHLRKYDHKPGMVLDEEGIPNPSVVIDVYGTRRGPKNKASGVAVSVMSSGKRSADTRLSSSNMGQQPAEMKHSQLSAALQGFALPSAQQHHMPASPAKSTSSTTSDLPSLTLNMSLQQQQQQQQQSAAANSHLLPPLASILQQNHNMAFFPYWNLNLQMLAAQQQAAVLAQLSPRMRETALQHMQQQDKPQDNEEHPEEDDDEEEEENFDAKSVDSAMDLSQGTPSKEEQLTPPVAMNLKLQEEVAHDTPLLSSISSNRRKGRVLKLDHLMQSKSVSQSPEQPSSPLPSNEMPTASSPLHSSGAPPPTVKLDEQLHSADESMEAAVNNNAQANAVANTSASSTASSSGNSSNSSNTSESSNKSSNSNSNNGNSSAPNGAIYECKYCDIYFKDAVLYTIHMGYHSCDDVFKCNMCGEKCDGPVGLFVHMARNAHS